MGSQLSTAMGSTTVVFAALVLALLFLDVQGHHVKCSDRLLPYCVCPDGSERFNLETVFNACGRRIKPESCTCNDGAVINPNCVPSTYYCKDGTTCQRNLCCDNSHLNVDYIECPDGSTFPPVEVSAGNQRKTIEEKTTKGKTSKRRKSKRKKIKRKRNKRRTKKRKANLRWGVRHRAG